MNPERIIYSKEGEKRKGPVVYWMQRDQRGFDNWALIYALQEADKKEVPLVVIFCLVNNFLQAGIRQFGFMLKGLEETEHYLSEREIPFILLEGNPGEEIPRILDELNASQLISDFNPLKIARKWKNDVLSNINIPYKTVDAHNIVPVASASDKLEFAAYTIRPKIKKKLISFLDEYPEISAPRVKTGKIFKIDWDIVRQNLKVDLTVKEIEKFTPGPAASITILKDFIENKLCGYAELRNDPSKDAVSNLSPYFHFGHISPQRVYLSFMNIEDSLNKEAFLEEMVIRRELADNFCLYNPNYDNPDGFHEWAKKTIMEHKHDEREHIYELKEFEFSETHDELWNAAQDEMVYKGKMAGYMRMYWAKKILEWTPDASAAMNYAIYLNDKYELDGRDPNGYAGIAWSIGGVHDRAWNERPVFGKIRYMNDKGCKRKFDVKEYILKNRINRIK